MHRIACREQFFENSFLWGIEAPDVAQGVHFVVGRRATRAIATCLKRGREGRPPSAADIAAFVPPATLASEAAL